MKWEEKYQEILMRIREGDDICPIMYAVSVIGQKWKIPILWQLSKHDQPMRFSEIRRALDLTDAMLSKTLDELASNGLVERGCEEIGRIDAIFLAALLACSNFGENYA